MCPEAAVQGSWDPPVGVVAKQVTRRVTMGKARTKAGHSKNVDGDGRRRLGRQRPPSLSAGERQRRPGEGQLDHVRGDGDGFAETLLSHTAANRTPSRCSTWIRNINDVIIHHDVYSSGFMSSSLYYIIGRCPESIAPSKPSARWTPPVRSMAHRLPRKKAKGEHFS
ncbi:hypothetical protein BHE74_00019338 [Ensete ventricosum]|nr:hypothetical protein BHE74_00019338 [Ensete ventricosum]RZS13263.1 hypothetical protein BHM03_00044822 [Ensete ventricosum]